MNKRLHESTLILLDFSYLRVGIKLRGKIISFTSLQLDHIFPKYLHLKGLHDMKITMYKYH